MSIGLITSTTYSGKTKDAFLAGLRANGWEGNPTVASGAKTVVSIVPYSAEGNYGNLMQVIQSWNQDSDINLIVSVGGLITALASNQSTNTPFIALYGTAPNPNFRSKFLGGVDLDLIGQDSARNAELSNSFGIDPASISLIWNAKSAMGRDERNAWARNGWSLNEQVRNNKDQDITDAIAKAKSNGAKGIVVSGDPFFTNRMDVLVDAANKSRLKVCYPFEVYKSAVPSPNAATSRLLGPDLVSAYQEMGGKAAMILTALKAGKEAPDTGVTKAKAKKYGIKTREPTKS
jgi:hypothetical protein